MNAGKSPFRRKNSKEVYKNPWIKVREDGVVRPDGKDGIFGVVEMQSGVTVVALTKDGSVVLAKEYKYAVERYTLECISGGMDSGETTLDAAKRELREETGAETDDWIDLGNLDPYTSIILGPNHMYLAQNITFTTDQHTDDGEIIDLIEIPFEEALTKVMVGEITHGASVAAILKTHLVLNGT